MTWPAFGPSSSRQLRGLNLGRRIARGFSRPCLLQALPASRAGPRGRTRRHRLRLLGTAPSPPGRRDASHRRCSVQRRGADPTRTKPASFLSKSRDFGRLTPPAGRGSRRGRPQHGCAGNGRCRGGHRAATGKGLAAARVRRPARWLVPPAGEPLWLARREAAAEESSPLRRCRNKG